MKKDKGVVKLPEKLGYMAYSTSANIVFNFKSLYYLIFLTNVLQIPVLTAGTMMTLGTIWDVTNDPIIGVFAGNVKFKSKEKIRPYLLVIAIPWALGLILLFTDFNLTQTLAVIVSLLIFFFYEIANTFRGIVYNGLGALASNNDDDRKSINAFRSLGACLGSGIGAVAVTPIVRLFGGLQEKNAIIGKGDARALFLTALVMGGLCVFGCLAHYFTSKERVQEKEEHEDSVSIKDTYKMLFKCKSWVWNMLYIMGYGICNTLIMSAINYYAAYILGSSSKATPILAAYLVVSIIMSLLTPKIDTLLGRKKTMYLGVISQIVGKVIFMLNPTNEIFIYINAISVGFGATITFIMLNQNRNNISDVVEIQNHRRLDAMVSTGDNLASKLAEALVTQLMAFALAAAGFNEALKINQTVATKNVICGLLGLVPCIVLVGMLITIRFLDIEKEKKESLEREGLRV
ncbi:MAG: MFS transporter [Erysipelotrichaceae bacterium]|nr:MFS transporter [Erysipelotrichaceae bacterium]